MKFRSQAPPPHATTMGAFHRVGHMGNRAEQEPWANPVTESARNPMYSEKSGHLPHEAAVIRCSPRCFRCYLQRNLQSTVSSSTRPLRHCKIASDYGNSAVAYRYRPPL